jgi:hypothetical protein
MYRFAGQEFLRDLTFELDTVTAVLCHGSSFRKPGRPVNSHSDPSTPRGALQPGAKLVRDPFLDIHFIFEIFEGAALGEVVVR